MEHFEGPPRRDRRARSRQFGDITRRVLRFVEDVMLGPMPGDIPERRTTKAEQSNLPQLAGDVLTEAKTRFTVRRGLKQIEQHLQGDISSGGSSSEK